MPSQKTFGRRATSQSMAAPEPPAAIRIVPAPEVASTKAVVSDPAASVRLADLEQGADVDRELEEWKAARKAQRRSFREPWRTLAIAATVGFGLSSWLLPESVADVAELVTGGLGAASFFAGFRLRPSAQKSSPGSGD